MTYRALFSLLAVASLAFCGEPRPFPDPPREMDIDIAWANLKAWPGLDDPACADLRENVLNPLQPYDGAPRPIRHVLLPASDGDGYLFVAQANWTVVLASLSADLSVRTVAHRPAKSGFSISWNRGLIVTLHRHPGTDMFWDEPYRVETAGGRLALTAIDTETAAVR